MTKTKEQFKWPAVHAVAKELQRISANVDGECDVRLQVYPDSSWAIRYGLSDCDQDHRGYWGSSGVPGCGGKPHRPHRFNSRDIAKDLLEQVKTSKAETESP